MRLPRVVPPLQTQTLPIITAIAHYGDIRQGDDTLYIWPAIYLMLPYAARTLRDNVVTLDLMHACSGGRSCFLGAWLKKTQPAIFFYFLLLFSISLLELVFCLGFIT